MAKKAPKKTSKRKPVLLAVPAAVKDGGSPTIWQTQFINMPSVTIKGRALHLDKDVSYAQAFSTLENLIQSRITAAMQSLYPSLEELGFVVDRIDFANATTKGQAEPYLPKAATNGKSDAAI